MKGRVLAVVLALLLVVLGAGAQWWAPTLFRYAGANANALQGLTSLIQLGLWGGAVFAFVVALWRRGLHPGKPVETGSTEVLLGKDGSAIATTGGVAAGQLAIGGNVSGDVILIADPDQLWEVLGRKRPAGDLLDATGTYLRHLVDRYQYLELRGMGVSDRIPLKLPILEMFVPLKARVEMPEGDAWARDLKLAGRPLDDPGAQVFGRRLGEPVSVMDLVRNNPGLVVLGDPGSGKTTLLKFLALNLAMGHGGLLDKAYLPFLLPLSAYANALAEKDIPLPEFFGVHYRGRGVEAPMVSILDEALGLGRALLLLDGLDEVKDRGRRRLVVDRVSDFFVAHQRKGNKFVLTSRIVGYRDVRPNVEGLAECTLVDFDDDDVKAFVARWATAIEKAARGDTAFAAAEAGRERDELLAAVGRNPGVRRLASNPLLLTILALMKRQGIELPERRVKLYEHYVKTLLEHWNLARGLDRPPSGILDSLEVLKVLAPVALWMQETSPGAGLVKREDLQRTIEEACRARGAADPEQEARELARDLREHAGLLIERGLGEYGFLHLTFQEYLAAVALARQGQQGVGPVIDALSNHVGEDSWREVALLTVGYLGVVQEREEAASAVVCGLVQRAPGEPGQAVVLAGEAVLDVGLGVLSATCRGEVVEALVSALSAAPLVPASRRVVAGRLLARLGDPRPGVGLGPDGIPDIAWCDVEAGEFPMGNLKGEVSYDRETPPFPCTLIKKPYRISRYPVTVAQYRAFVAAGGYGEERFWTKAGWEWKGDRQAPETSGTPFDLPNHPVVDVTWYEAVAFCNWLSERLEHPVSLPTEAQWERAARHTDARTYPWGNEGEPAERCNMVATGIGSTSAAGLFPGGDAVCGPADMAGNVLEWCRTKRRANYHEYEKKVDDDPDGGEDRVLRGGSFSGPARDVRCAYRGGDPPHYRLMHLGFRVVASPRS